MFSITTGEFVEIQDDLGRALEEPVQANGPLPELTHVPAVLANPFSALRWRRVSDGVEHPVHQTQGIPAIGGQSILVVDDDIDVRNMAVAVLEHSGFTVLAADCARDAFHLLEVHPEIALMLTDVVMPGLDGLMLADMAILRHNDLRIIYTSGYAERVQRQPGYRYGPTLLKPYRASELEHVVALELEQAEIPQ
jgi:CheY-like chemotaxis protein